MEIRKHHKADLESKRGLFFQAGILVSLVLILTAFEWRSYEHDQEDPYYDHDNTITEEIIPINSLQTPLPVLPTRTGNESGDVIIKIVEEVITGSETDLNNAGTSDTNALVSTDVLNTVHIENTNIEPEIYTIVDEPPAFPGGEEARYKFFQKNIIYPKFARENNIHGVVFVTFVVEPDGSITNVRILQGIGSGCDEETLKVVRSMPKWIPGKKNQQPIRVQVTMPLTFTLQS